MFYLNEFNYSAKLCNRLHKQGHTKSQSLLREPSVKIYIVNKITLPLNI